MIKFNSIVFVMFMTMSLQGKELAMDLELDREPLILYTAWSNSIIDKSHALLEETLTQLACIEQQLSKKISVAIGQDQKIEAQIENLCAWQELFWQKVADLNFLLSDFGPIENIVLSIKKDAKSYWEWEPVALFKVLKTAAVAQDRVTYELRSILINLLDELSCIEKLLSKAEHYLKNLDHSWDGRFDNKMELIARRGMLRVHVLLTKHQLETRSLRIAVKCKNATVDVETNENSPSS